MYPEAVQAIFERGQYHMISGKKAGVGTDLYASRHPWQRQHHSFGKWWHIYSRKLPKHGNIPVAKNIKIRVILKISSTYMNTEYMQQVRQRWMFYHLAALKSGCQVSCKGLSIKPVKEEFVKDPQHAWLYHSDW